MSDSAVDLQAPGISGPAGDPQALLDDVMPPSLPWRSPAYTASGYVKRPSPFNPRMSGTAVAPQAPDFMLPDTRNLRLRIVILTLLLSGK